MSLDLTLLDKDGNPIASFNTTHNHGDMAREAEIYMPPWRPEECDDIHFAGDIVKALSRGIFLMVNDPDRFTALEPSNGWGSYEAFLAFCCRVRRACIDNPEATLLADR